jgi:hypothetical protein
MKAFISEYNSISKQPRLGSLHATVSGNYKTIATMFKYAIKPFMNSHKSDVIVEAFYNWDNRYGMPDITLIYTKDKDGNIQCERLPKGNYNHKVG